MQGIRQVCPGIGRNIAFAHLLQKVHFAQRVDDGLPAWTFTGQSQTDFLRQDTVNQKRDKAGQEMRLNPIIRFR